MELFDRFLAAENEFFAHFGYFPSRSRYPERHVILDFRENHWLLLNHEGRMAVCYSAQRLTGLSFEIGSGIFAEAILDWLGASVQSSLRGGMWRGPEYTLIATGLPNDGPRRYLLFANAKECRDTFLVRMAIAQTLA